MKMDLFDAGVVDFRFRAAQCFEDCDGGLLRAIRDLGLADNVANLLQSAAVFVLVCGQ